MSRMEQYTSLYRFSNIAVPTSGVDTSFTYFVFWWTPDAIVDVSSGTVTPRRNVLSLAAMSILPGYIGLGFNTDGYVNMNGVGIIGIPEQGINLYALGFGFVTQISYIFNFSSVETLDGFTTMQIVWDLNIPNSVLNFVNISNSLSVIFSSSSQATLIPHDWYGGVVAFDLVNGTKATPLVKNQICDCTLQQIPNNANLTHCPCSCPGSAVLPTCTNSSLPFQLSLFDGTYGLSTIRWRVIGNMTHLDVQSNGPAKWFAIGFANSEAGSMIGTQAIVYTPQWVQSRNLVSHSYSGLHIIGALNISSIQSWSLQNGYPGFHFAVPTAELTTSGVVYLVGASSPDDELDTSPHKYQTNGAYTINLISGNVVQPSFVWSIKATHGLLMYLSWGLIFPFGYLWARYAKGLPQAMWFEGHRIAMTTGFILVLAGSAVAFGMVSNHFKTVWHAQVGMTALVLCLLQVCSGILRPHLDVNKKKSLKRIAFEIIHHLFGRLGILCSWVAIYGGLAILNLVPVDFIYLHISICVIWILIHLFLEVRAWRTRRSKSGYDIINTNTNHSNYGVK
eukprot:TRINITY_DN216_c0_g1_i1.p1 TRINITY_DN216_c0_g1~~TRINITY_DN216_c0_g1_i1.p1  ORF type:complete len:587 (-),score=62.64 TRINITY_DN216_c0_g1_i1:152-1840(-)